MTNSMEHMMLYMNPVTLNIAGSVGHNDGDISGADMIYNYEQVLRQVIYTNEKPAHSCSSY